jgi:hypothetical protein
LNIWLTTTRQEHNTKTESLNTQIDGLKKDLQKYHQLSDDLQEQKNLVSQLKEQHSIESGKQKTKLEDACKHYQNTLKEEQNKLELMIQELEVSKSDVGRLKLETTKNQEALEAKESVIVELNGRVSGIEQKLTEAESEILSLEKSHAEVSHLLSIAQNSASKHRSYDRDVQAPQLTSALKATSAGAHSIKTPAVPVKKSIQYVKPFNPSASPPSTTKHRESPKTKKRDRSKVPQNMHLPSNIFPDRFPQVEEIPAKQADFGKFVSQQGSQIQHQDEERHRRIFTWMEQSNGVAQQVTV